MRIFSIINKDLCHCSEKVVLMHAVSVILFLIDAAIILGPIAGVAITYQNNWEGLVIPRELNEILNQSVVNEISTPANGTSITVNGTSVVVNGTSINGTSTTGQQIQVSQPVVTQTNFTERTVTFSVNFTNPLSFDVTLQDMHGTVRCKEHKTLLGNATLNGTTKILASQTTEVSVLCKWTENGQSHFLTAHSDAAAIDVEMTNVVVNLNGLVMELPDPIQIPNVPTK